MKKTLIILVMMVVSIAAYAHSLGTYGGKIGPSSVQVSFASMGGCTLGDYVYIANPDQSFSLTLKSWTRTGSIWIETAPNGLKTGKWIIKGNLGDSVLTGTFINLINGKKYSIRLNLIDY